MMQSLDMGQQALSNPDDNINLCIQFQCIFAALGKKEERLMASGSKFSAHMILQCPSGIVCAGSCPIYKPHLLFKNRRGASEGLCKRMCVHVRGESEAGGLTSSR